MPSKEAILREMVKASYWWERGAVDEKDALPYKRRIFGELLAELDERRITGIIGARRTGKTTLMYQLVRALLEKGVDAKSVLMFSFDNPLMSADEQIIPKVLETYRETFQLKGTAFVFLDEVQYVKDWSRWLKGFHDRKEPFKFVVSGSSGTLIYKDTSESLAGRVSFHRVGPFSFPEFAEYHDPKLGKFLEELGGIRTEELFSDRVRARIEFHKGEALSLFNRYLIRGGIPEAFQQELKAGQKWLRSDYVGLVFYRDLMKLFEVRDIRTLEELFFFAVNAHAQRINYSRIAGALGTRIETVKQYLGYLEAVKMVTLLNCHSRSAKKVIRAEKKIYIADSGLRNAVLGAAEEILADEQQASFEVEGIVGAHLDAKFSTDLSRNVYFWRSLHELDFVADDRRELMPVEVKYSSNVDARDLRGLLTFMEEFGVTLGYVVTKDLLRKEGNLLYIPAWLFLCTIAGR